MPHCPSCEAEYTHDAEECPSCGTEVAVTCAQCGERYAGADACPACGRVSEGVEVACATHADRTAAARCVICERALCQACSTGDAGRLCEEHRAVPLIEGWAQVYSTTGELKAELLRENLRAEGIDAQVFSQRDRAFSLDIGELSIVRLLVPAWEYAQALKIIRQHMDTEGEVTFACPACGEAYDPGERECASCGGALV